MLVFSIKRKYAMIFMAQTLGHMLLFHPQTEERVSFRFFFFFFIIIIFSYLHYIR